MEEEKIGTAIWFDDNRVVLGQGEGSACRQFWKYLVESGQIGGEYDKAWLGSRVKITRRPDGLFFSLPEQQLASLAVLDALHTGQRASYVFQDRTYTIKKDDGIFSVDDRSLEFEIEKNGTIHVTSFRWGRGVQLPFVHQLVNDTAGSEFAYLEDASTTGLNVGKNVVHVPRASFEMMTRGFSVLQECSFMLLLETNVVANIRKNNELLEKTWRFRQEYKAKVQERYSPRLFNRFQDDVFFQGRNVGPTTYVYSKFVRFSREERKDEGGPPFFKAEENTTPVAWDLALLKPCPKDLKIFYERNKQGQLVRVQPSFVCDELVGVWESKDQEEERRKTQLAPDDEFSV